MQLYRIYASQILYEGGGVLGAVSVRYAQRYRAGLCPAGSGAEYQHKGNGHPQKKAQQNGVSINLLQIPFANVPGLHFISLFASL